MLTLAAWFHDLSPYIVRLGDGFGIRWYGASYLAGFAIAWWVLVRLSRRGLCSIPAERVGDAMLWLIGGTLVGGRLGYALVYDRTLLTATFDSFPFWGLLAINRGGMASHGGMVGLMVACWRISRGWRNERGEVEGRASMLHVLDMVALVAPFGLLLGRLANFVNGELLGKIVSAPGREGPWWSVQYPQELDLPLGLVPGLQRPETAGALERLAVEAAGGRGGGGDQTLAIGLSRLAERAGAYEEQLRPLLASRHPSQLYQAAAEGIVLGAILWLTWMKTKAVGVMTGVFCVVYGVLRVVTEIWRLPDAQFGDEGRPYGLSRGQWLSVAMVVVGVGMLGWVRMRGKNRDKRGSAKAEAGS